MKQEEKEFVDKLIKPLTNHFNIQQEVKSKCGKGRIDLVLQSKENDNIYFGVECKKPDKKRGEEMARFVKQAIRYTDYEFLTSKGIYRKIPVVLCPPLSYNYFILNEYEQHINGELWHKDRHNATHEHHSFNGLLGQFNVGEIRNLDKYYIISFSNKIIFSTRKNWHTKQIEGIHEANYNKLITKIYDNTI